MGTSTTIIYLTVTNSLTYDQRMHRICTSLHNNGYQVFLVGIKRPDTLPDRPYKQIRLTSWFKKGKLFYLENHLRLFCYLLFRKAELLVANDLDTALPVWLISKIRSIPRLMDAHEYFIEMKEVMSRPAVYRIWSGLASFLLPRFPVGYTVGGLLAEKFKLVYGVQYGVVRNLPHKRAKLERVESAEKIILYQGAVNHGRGFETLIPAMRMIPYQLVICGDGNFMDELRALIRREDVDHRVQLTGMISPEELREWALRATIGIALPDREGANQYLALTNKFFNYIEAGLPQITYRYPEYEAINDQFPVAMLLDETDPVSVSKAVNELMNDESRRMAMTNACIQAREVYYWENEEVKLLSIYKRQFQR
jgi:glycosyltransferase involved in cell wall biosynthesis